MSSSHIYLHVYIYIYYVYIDIIYIYKIYLHVKHIHTLDIVAYHHGRSPLPSGVRRADHCASRVLMRERSCEKGSSPT